MSHELPEHLTHIDEVSTILLSQYELLLREGGFDYETSRPSKSLEVARYRALVRVTSQWLADLAKQGKRLVVATQHCCRYFEGSYGWSEDKPWQTIEAASASDLFDFVEYDYYGGCFDDCYDKVHCFVTE